MVAISWRQEARVFGISAPNPYFSFYTNVIYCIYYSISSVCLLLISLESYFSMRYKREAAFYVQHKFNLLLFYDQQVIFYWVLIMIFLKFLKIVNSCWILLKNISFAFCYINFITISTFSTTTICVKNMKLFEYCISIKKQS